MTKKIYTDGDEGVQLIVRELGEKPVVAARSPVHVLYGGAHLYTAGITEKLGRLALESLESYAPNFVEFARAMKLPDSGDLPRMLKAVTQLAAKIESSPARAKEREPAAWLAWTIHQRTLAKLNSEPVEDFRIDFEDGYGFRSDAEEDGHAKAAASELANALQFGRVTAFSGFRIKSFAKETRERAIRTLEIFLDTFFLRTKGRLPDNFVVTLPKVTGRKQIKQLCKLLTAHEKNAGIEKGSIGIEIMIETPEAIIDAKGRVPLRSFIEAAGSRSVSVHFGAYDYTSSLSIAAPFQDIRHPSCDFARQIMQASLAPLEIRLSDSVTTQLPVAVNRGEDLSEGQKNENHRSVHAGWRRHFENVTHSMSSGFYQSWDVHPHQLPARYAAVYSFFLHNYEEQARRLAGFVAKSMQASISGSMFDDAASAQGVLNFFRRALDCGALTDDEVEKATRMNAEQIKTMSFADLPG